MVLEYNCRDIYNVHLHKKYAITGNDIFVGERSMAVNTNYLLHLIFNPETEEQVIRVYSRSSTNWNTPLYEVPVSPDCVGNFIGFPNKLFDRYIYRDERQLNMTGLQ
jgi:hypothetical protein